MEVSVDKECKCMATTDSINDDADVVLIKKIGIHNHELKKDEEWIDFIDIFNDIQFLVISYDTAVKISPS